MSRTLAPYRVRSWFGSVLGVTGVSALSAIFLAAGPTQAQDSDRVILRSGNPVVGEVKNLRRGKLNFDTPEMDVVPVDWDDIASVTSPLFFEVETAGGALLYGSLAGADTAQLIVIGPERSDTLDFRDVVAIEPIESGFLARTNGYVDLGTNIAKANSLRSFQLAGTFAYAGPKWGFSARGDFYRQSQKSMDDLGQEFDQRTSRSTAEGSLNRFLGARWVATAAGRIESNDELNLDRRLLGMLGGQYAIVRNQGIELLLGAGGALNSEQYVDTDAQTSGEILLTAAFDVFDVGDVDVYTGLDTYTSPASGRFRVNFDGRVSWEIFNDFYLGFTATQKYDSKPPSEGAEKSDFQYGATIGWSWS